MLNDKDFGKDLSGKNFVLALGLPLFLTLMHLVLHVAVQSAYSPSDKSSWFNLIFLPLGIALFVIGTVYLLRFITSKNWKPMMLMLVSYLNMLVILILYLAQS